jgi:ribosomal protein S18 acetylase RimI-like enzyme
LTGNFFGRDFIELLYVAEECRRCGIGNAILETIEHARPSSRIFTSTNELNIAMRSLLEKRGYQLSGKIENLNADNPELVFVKFLTGANTK